MTENLTRLQEFKKIINIPLAIIIASIIIIIVTTNMTDTNGLSALLGGYSGLLIGMLFIVILNVVFINTSYLDLCPAIMIMIIVSLMIFYLGKYFDRISRGEVSYYYSSFSILSTIFLITQVIVIFNSMYIKIQEPSTKLFSDVTFSLLGLFGVINMLIVLTIGIILHFYSTQG